MSRERKNISKVSNTAAIYPIITSVVKAEEFIGPDRAWQPTNPTQTIFLNEFFASCRQESLSVAEIESIASFSSYDINHFLRERGFNIEVPPFQNGSDWEDLGIASVLDILIDWRCLGMATNVKGWDQKVYSAVSSVDEECKFYRAAHHRYPIVQMPTTSSDRVYMTRFDSAPSNFELIHVVQRLSNSLRPTNDYSRVVFPMVDLKQEVDISWLVGLETASADGKPVKIMHAQQETHLGLNEYGARARSAVAVVHRIGGVTLPKTLTINRPFLIWFLRPELTQPLFVAHVTEEDWKNPGKIGGPSADDYGAWDGESLDFYNRSHIDQDEA